MKIIKRVILSYLVLLCFMATSATSASSSSLVSPTTHTENGSTIRQVESPFERTLKVIYLNSKADLSHVSSQMEDFQSNNERFCTADETDCSDTDGAVAAKIGSNTLHRQYEPYPGPDYYVYALRKILR